MATKKSVSKAAARPSGAAKSTTRKPSPKATKPVKPSAKSAKAAKPRPVAAKKPSGVARDVKSELAATLAWIAKSGSKQVRDGMARYGIPSGNAVGISVGTLKAYAKKLGKSHELALALWKSDIYEARMLATFLGEAAQCTSAQMDEWRRDFDSWALCDTACFALFDRSPHALAKIRAWAKLPDEFGKRASFALLASVAVHVKDVPDAAFDDGLALIRAAAGDERNFVKKAVNWALRSIGKRNPALHSRALALASELAASKNATERWTGKDAVRDLGSPSSKRRLSRQSTSR